LDLRVKFELVAASERRRHLVGESGFTFAAAQPTRRPSGTNHSNGQPSKWKPTGQRVN